MAKENAPGRDPSPEEIWTEIEVLHEEIDAIYWHPGFFEQLPEETQLLWSRVELKYEMAKDPRWRKEKNLPELKGDLENLSAIFFEAFEKYEGRKPN